MQTDSGVFVFYSDPISYKSIGTKGETQYILEGYISTSGLDLVDDVVTKNGLDSMFEQLKDRIMKLDFEHEAFKGDTDLEKEIAKTKMPLGKAVDQAQDAKGVKVKWLLNPSWKQTDKDGKVVTTFKQVWKSIEDGFLDAFSIAYIPTKTAMREVNGKKIRLLDDTTLLNVALTGTPANTDAKMTNFSAVAAKSVEFMAKKEKDKDKDKGKKPYKKAYDKDGAHAHTEQDPLGDHNHPEIENMVSNVWNAIDDLRDEIRNPVSDNDDTMLKGNTMADKDKDKQDPAALPAKKEDPQNDPPADGDNAGDGSNGEDSDGADDAGTQTTEGKTKTKTKPTEDPQIIEVKKQVEEQKKELDGLKKENEKLKEIVEKARQKATGAPDKTKTKDAPAKVGGTLNMI